MISELMNYELLLKATNQLISQSLQLRKGELYTLRRYLQ